MAKAKKALKAVIVLLLLVFLMAFLAVEYIQQPPLKAGEPTLFVLEREADTIATSSQIINFGGTVPTIYPGVIIGVYPDPTPEEPIKGVEIALQGHLDWVERFYFWLLYGLKPEVSRMWNRSFVVKPFIIEEDFDPGYNDNEPVPDKSAAILASLSAEDSRPSYYETMSFLTGKVALNVVFVSSESNPFTTGELDEIKGYLNQGAADVSSANQAARLQFFFQYYDLNVEREPTNLTHSQARDELVPEALGKIQGISGSNWYDVVRLLDNNARDQWGTDWGITVAIFRGERFTDDWFAWGYKQLGAMATSECGSYGTSAIGRILFFHEIFHTGGAVDEYLPCNCDTLAGYLYGPNANCAACSSTGCVMKGQVFDQPLPPICLHTKRHIGWSDESPIDGRPDVNNITFQFEVNVKEGLSPGSTDLSIEVAIVPHPPGKEGQRAITINNLSNICWRRKSDQAAWQCSSQGVSGLSGEHTFIIKPAASLSQLEVYVEDDWGNSFVWSEGPLVKSKLYFPLMMK